MEHQHYCLITGASRGIGRDLAREFAHNGHSLILVARDKVALTVLKDELHAYTPDIKLFECDLADRQNCIHLVEQLKQQNLTVDILVNNAGGGLCDNFATMTLQSILQMIDVNMTALTLLTRLILPEMLRRKQGRILNVSSTAAFQPGPIMAVYYATKAYVLSLSEALSEELREHGISVTALCPGPTDTDFKRSAKTSGSHLGNIFGFMSSFKVAKVAYAATMKGKRVVIPGIINRLLVWSVKISPHVVVLKVMKYLNERK